MDRTNFLLSLAFALANVCDPPMALGTELFVNKAAQSTAADPFTVLSNYGGPAPEDLDRMEEISIQMFTTSSDDAAGMAHNGRLYDALFDCDDGRYDPPRMRCEWTIDGKMMAGGQVVDDPSNQYFIEILVPKGPPGSLGRDEKNGKFYHAFNFDCRFVPAQ